MSFLSVSSPHHSAQFQTSHLMLKVCLATLPGLAALTWFFGWGTFIQVIWCVSVAVGVEAMMLRLRQRPILTTLKDYSAVVTALLLALSIPPYAPWWIGLIGAFFAISIGKHLYGGLGFNPFNPAMLAYALLLISFPVQMTIWVNPDYMQALQPKPLAAVQGIFFNEFSETFNPDAYTMATPLDALKNAARSEDNLNLVPTAWVQGWAVELFSSPWAIINLGFLLGGFLLLKQKVFSWHAPVGVLLGLGLAAGLGFVLNPMLGSPSFHLLSGASCFAAFFIVTDPVSGASSVKGRFLFGFIAGALTYIIRTQGGYPDAFAFAVLLMNLTAPTLDYFTKPRVYGHSKANNPLIKK